MKNDTHPIEFEIRTHVVFGSGKINDLKDILSQEKFNSIAVVIDSTVSKNDNITNALESARKEGVLVDVFENKVAEPDYDYLDEFKSRFPKEYDCIIGIGGGSTIDLAKGIATLLKNTGPAIQYKGFPKLEARPLPVIAIPTTAGTGSEVTYNAVFTDNKEKRKLGINSKYNYPIHAILDPELTASCPAKVTVSSGMDALTHTLESFVAKRATTYSRMFSKQAFGLLFDSLMQVLDHPDDMGIRGNILLGAHFAGVALMNSGAGPAGAMSYPLGAVYKVPHGIAGAVFLDKIVRFNVENGYDQYNKLYDMIEGADRSLSVEEKNKAFVKKIGELSIKLEVPKRLTDFGIKKEDVLFLIEQIFGGLKGAIDMNPVVINEADMRKILNTMF